MFQGLRFEFLSFKKIHIGNTDCNAVLTYYWQGSALSTNEESESDVDGLGLESFAGISVQLAEGGPMVAFSSFFCIALFVS